MRPAARIALCLLLGLSANLPALAKSAASVDRELERVRSRIEALNTALDSDRERRDAVDAEVEATEKRLAAGKAELKRLTRELTQRQTALARAQSARDEAERRLGQEREALARQLRVTYVTGQREQTRLLLSQDSAAAVGRLLTYHDYLSRARATRVQGVKADAEQLIATEKNLLEETERLAETRRQNEQALAAERKEFRERQRLLARLQERVGDEEDQLKRLKAGEKDLSKVLENVRTVLADAPVRPPAEAPPGSAPAKAFGQARGRMAWPLRGPLIANYGDPKVGGKLAWKGLWIAADRGDAVRASARGRVAYVGYMHRYGLIVILEHEDGYFTLYGHLERAAVKAGDYASANAGVGEVGDSGGHERTGVYFEVRKGTEPLDPRDWLMP